MVQSQGSLKRALLLEGSLLNGRKVSTIASAGSYIALAGACACIIFGAILFSQETNVSAPVSLEDKQDSGFSIGGLTKDLEKATKMFDSAQPVPVETSQTSTSVTRRRVQHSRPSDFERMNHREQMEFEKEVTNDVTRRVAKALISTMKPLKRVLKEQQEKIEELEKGHVKALTAEKRIASRLATNLKAGLVKHLKADVDAELQQKITSAVLVKAEKAKLALHKRMEVKARRGAVDDSSSSSSRDRPDSRQHRVRHERAASESEEHAAAKHSDAAARAKTHALLSVKGRTDRKAHKAGCDPLAGLYTTGRVSWC